MNINFDSFSQQEKPNLILCNPSGSQIYSLGSAYDVKFTLRFNALSELTFSYPKSIDSMSTNLEEYEYIKGKRLIYIEEFGYFLITDSQEDFDGLTPIKKVVCQSRESELIFKKITATSGTYQFYNPLNPDDSIMGKVIALCPGWSIGTIETALQIKYRTFEVKDATIYNFLMTTLSNTYGCVFTFDTINKTISATLIDNATSQTDVFFSFDNVLKSGELKEKTDEIITAMYCYGSGDLDIRTVNPLGTSVIYNFDYYKNTDWMSQELIDAITAWENTIATFQPEYADKLTLLKEKNAELIDLESDLADAKNNYLAQEGVQKARIETGQSYDDILPLLAQYQAEIDDLEDYQIPACEQAITDILAYLQTINAALDPSALMSPSLYNEFNSFVFENTYQNENIIQLDSMTPVQVQEQAQELYDQSQGVLARVSQPRYEFSVSALNFLAIEDFSPTIAEIELGSVVTIEPKEDYIVSVVLLEISFNFDNPNDFSMTFSNRVRLDNGSFVYSDLMGQVVKTGTSVSFDSVKWSSWNDEYKTDVSEFVSSALDASRNNVVNADNQEILINQNGLRGRQALIGGGYDDKQVWLTSSVLAFTKDNWNSASLAVGNIEVEGQSQYGIVAEAVVGTLILGENLNINTGDSSFVVDSQGARLTNASFTLISPENKYIMTLEPETGIKIQKNNAGTFVDTLFIDSEGNLNFAGELNGASGNFAGTITAESGVIGGWVIDPSGIKSEFGSGAGNYIYSDGRLKFGGMEINGDSAKFQGDIYANNFYGVIKNNNIDDNAVTSRNIGNGSLPGDKIYGGTITGPGGFLLSLGTSGTGVAVMSCDNKLAIYGGGGIAGIEITNGLVILNAGTGTGKIATPVGNTFEVQGTFRSIGSSTFNGTVTSKGKSTLTTSVTISGTTLEFKNGMLTAVT